MYIANINANINSTVVLANLVAAPRVDSNAELAPLKIIDFTLLKMLFQSIPILLTKLTALLDNQVLLTSHF